MKLIFVTHRQTDERKDAWIDRRTSLQIFWLQKLQLLAVLRVQLESGFKLQYLQPSTAATFSCYICNFKLQILKLHKLLIQSYSQGYFPPE